MVKYQSGAIRFAFAIFSASIFTFLLPSVQKKMLEEKAPKEPKLIGSVSSGCRLTSLELVVAPSGAVEPKIKDEEMEDSKKFVPVVATISPAKRGVVTVELEGSDDEDQVPKVKKVKKTQKAAGLKMKAKGNTNLAKKKAKAKKCVK